VTGGALAITLLACGLLLGVVVVNGLGVFWPASVAEVHLAEGTKRLGERIRSETDPYAKIVSFQFKTGNRELDPGRQDFRWYEEDQIDNVSYPADVYVLERIENGDFYGYLREVTAPTLEVAPEGALPHRLDAAIAAVRQKHDREMAPIDEELSGLSEQLRQIRLETLKTEYRKRHVRQGSPEAETATWHAQLKELQQSETRIKQQSDGLVAQQEKVEKAIRENVAVFADAAGQNTTIALADIVRAYQPNDMGVVEKVGHYGAKVAELLVAEPRESNTEGGLFPAIFGTVMLIFLMAISCFPLGVLAGIYLGEYAKDGVLVRLVRIAVNNLAGIPSIVYGIFGLGFFIYGVGAWIDQWFYPERVEAGISTFGTGGILWASLTLGLLTIPVVIVSTEEALRTIPRGIHESSLALGSTKFQTLWRVLLPMASPGIMTGFILAMARAAGEVAPLMIVGVVKLAPDMPVDGSFPFFHLDRKFMHLGFHVYDIGFQSPNVEASKPMVYVTTLLLLLIVLAMSSAAIYLRNRMRKRFQLRTI